MNQSTSIDELEKWEDAITRIFHSDLGGKIENPLGDAPTIVFVGPTGSGKTALLNTIIGRTILPEGTDHTTPVPTILLNGSPPSIRALDIQGQPVPDIPELPLFIVGLTREVPSKKAEIKEVLKRKESYKDIESQWKMFWEPAFRKAKEGLCHFIEFRLPLPWIPENVRIADIPGYEGWRPEESPELHNLVTNWVKNADHSIFIMEKTKVLLDGGFKFLTFVEHQDSITLLVNQMDSFNPTQIQGIEKEEQAFDVFQQRLRDRLSEETISSDRLDIFLGAARMERRCKPWMEDRIHTEMGGWFQHFENILQNITFNFQERKEREQKKKEQEKQQKIEVLKCNVEETVKAAFEKAKEKFLSDDVVFRVQNAVASAIEEVDVGFTDLFSKEELAERYQKRISAKAGNTLKNIFEEAMEVYGEHIRKKLQDAVKEFLGQMNRQGVYIDQNRLSEQIRQGMGDVSGEVAGSLTVLLGGLVMSIVGSLLMVETAKILFITIASTINPIMLTAAIAGALVSLLAGGKLFSVKERVSKKLRISIVPKFNQDKMELIWADSTKSLIHTTFYAIWNGKDANGRPLKINGKHFKGLETLIRESA